MQYFTSKCKICHCLLTSVSFLTHMTFFHRIQKNWSLQASKKECVNVQYNLCAISMSVLQFMINSYSQTIFSYTVSRSYWISDSVSRLCVPFVNVSVVTGISWFIEKICSKEWIIHESVLLLINWKDSNIVHKSYGLL